MPATGTITFLFTDIEGSTSLWESYPQAMRSALARHDALLTGVIERSQGAVIKSTGDGMLAVFSFASGAVEAAIAGQFALSAEPWPETGPLRVRMGIHSGEAQARDGDYYGPDVNRAARIMGLASGCQILLSSASAELVRARLPEGVAVSDLGLHRLRDIEQPQQIFQLTVPGLPESFPPLGPSATPGNLPLQATNFVGRHRETAEIESLLGKEAGPRLVTIVGPGGIGKSRLAIEAAADLAGQFQHGVFFVPLAPLSDGQDIVAAIRDGIGIRTPGADDLREGLLTYLRHKQLLLIMDNFEHVLAGTDIVADILQSAPQVKVLSTSRERLNLSSETVYLLSGLDYPTDSGLPKEEVAGFGAIQLLLDRVRAVRPGLEVEGPELGQVARICRLVQGMPLALVLAASWMELLTFEEMADEITASVDILESEARDMPERQRSVRAVFDYSWQRLAAEERQAFSRLAVFRGGFSRQAAQQVAGAGLRALRTLAGKSLITIEGRDRYTVHELLRQFAEEELEAAGQARAIRDAHSGYYLEAVAQREGDIKGRRQLEALDEIEVDLDNVREAWTWAQETEDWPAIDQAVESMALFFYIRSRNQEGWSMFRQALGEVAARQPLDDESQRLWGRLAARAALLQSQFTSAAPEIEQSIQKSLAIAGAQADQGEIAYGYLALGHYHSRVTGDFSLALDYFRQSLERFREVADLYHVAHLLHRIGYCHTFTSGVQEYVRYTRQSLDLARQIGDLSDEANALSNLGWGVIEAGEYEDAERYSREAAVLSERMGDRAGHAHALVLLALCHVLFNRLDEAEETATKSMLIAEDILFSLTQAYALAILGARASLDGDYETGRKVANQSQEHNTNPSGDYFGQWAQAMALVGMSQTEQAKRQVHSALELCLVLGSDVRSIWMLPAVAIILAQEGQPARAAETLGLYFNHPHRPSGFARSWSLLNEWQARLQEELGAQGYETAQKQGEGLDLDKAIHRLVTEWEELP